MAQLEFNRLSEDHKQVLDALLSLEIQPLAVEQEAGDDIQTGDPLTATVPAVRRRADAIQQIYFNTHSQLDKIDDLLHQLTESNLIKLEGDTLSLSQSGRVAARLARGERIGRMFSDTLIRYQQSEAHSEFCRRVFGIDLSQADLMDKFQLDTLLEVLSLSADSRVLDLACGTGRIAEYISDTTGANVLGIDVAREALEYARQRTTAKRQRLDFQFGNMDQLDLPPAGFDAVIAVASIHYAHSIEATIGQLKQALTPNGQMALFSFQYRGENDPPEILLPENTSTGKALRQHGLTFTSWDFTEREIEVRRKQVQAANDLMPIFEAEGNGDLARDRIEECQLDLPRLEAGDKRRYLFHARRVD